MLKFIKLSEKEDVDSQEYSYLVGKLTKLARITLRAEL